MNSPSPVAISPKPTVPAAVVGDVVGAEVGQGRDLAVRAESLGQTNSGTRVCDAGMLAGLVGGVV